MKEFWKNLKGWQKVSIVFGMVAIIVTVVVIVVLSFFSGPNVEITFDDMTNIPANEMSKVREKMVGVIRTNTADFNDRIIYKGVARDYKESSENDLIVASFVVDFDTIMESYKVEVWWPDLNDGSPNVIINCPIFDTKYPNTPCVTEMNSSLDIMSYLPYTGKTESGLEYEITGGYDNGSLYLDVDVNSCGDTEIIDMAVTAAKEWVTRHGFNPDDYLFFARTDICDGGDYTGGNYYVQINHAKTSDQNVNEYLPYFVPDLFHVYPVVDENNNVTEIKVDIAGCTNSQTDPAEEQVNEYLDMHGISYPRKYTYCVN